MPYREVCAKCGATRIDAQIGLEPTLDAYVTDLVTVFREVRRVLKPSGVLVLNLGDSYMGGGGGNYNKTGVNNAGGQHVTNVRNRPDFIKSNGLKPKDLCMVPARVALALQADGWWLRSMIPWVKRNCLSGGAWLYARTQKGDMPVMLKDLVRLNPETVKLWDGVKWNQVVSWTPADVTERTGLLEIELRSGERIGCTGEHRFPTERGLLHARDMKVGDVLTKVTLPQPDCVVMPPNMDDSFGWLVGMYLAEGHKQGNGIILSGHVKEQHRTDILRGFANLFGADVRVHGNGNTNAATWHITSRVLRAIIDTYIGGHDAKDKHLTSACWQRSNAFLDRVLAGYLEGDGHYDAANNRWRLGFTANDGLARDLRTLCARLGYSIRLKRSKVTAIKDGTEFKSYRGEIRIEMYRGSTSTQFQPKRNTEIVAIRASRARHYWDVELADDPHVFALASGVLTHNSLPESVTDRPSSAVEYIFILAKSKSYYWDGEAVKREAAQPFAFARLTGQHKSTANGQGTGNSTLGAHQGDSRPFLPQLRCVFRQHRGHRERQGADVVTQRGRRSVGAVGQSETVQGQSLRRVSPDAGRTVHKGGNQ